VVSRRDDSQSQPQPGVGLGNSSQESLQVSEAELAAARERVETQCLQCHDEDSISDQTIQQAQYGTAEPMIPRRWLRHGLYDHAAHRRIDCGFCHAGAYPDADASSAEDRSFIDHQHVMISGIETCQGCHREAAAPLPEDWQRWVFTSTSGSSPAGQQPAGDARSPFGGMPSWASDRCTTCHRYHPPDLVKDSLP